MPHEKDPNNSNDSNYLNRKDNIGLYILSVQSSSNSIDRRNEQQLKFDNNNLLSNAPPGFINWKPSVGKCKERTNHTIKNNFSVNSNTCELINNINLCGKRQGAALGSNGCYQCLADSNYYYVRSTSNITMQETTLQVSGSGSCTFSLGSNTWSSNITLSPSSNTVIIPRDSDGYPADGKTLLITLDPINNTPPYIQGYFVGDIRTTKTSNIYDQEKKDIAITAYDVTSGSNITPNYENGDPIKLKPNSKYENLKLSILIPYAYVDKKSVESINCQGPYIRSSNVANVLQTDSCFITGSNTPGNYNQKCLQGIFTAAGCTSNGSGFPNSFNMNALLKDNGSNRTLGEISQYVVKQHFQAIHGTTISGVALDTKEIIDSTQFCIDAKKELTDACGALTDEMKANGPVSLKCIQYIFNDGSNDAAPYGTYDRSIYRNINNENVSNGNAKSLWSGSLKDRFCTSNGSMAPTEANLKLLRHITSNGTSNANYVGVESIKQFYRNIHLGANKTGITNAEREVYVKQCYDSNYTLQSDGVLEPAMVLGEEKATTTCGIKAKYIRITGADTSVNSNPYVKISQLIAIDARGQNVALKKKASSSSLYPDTSREAPVDGVYENRGDRANIFVSAGTGPTEWYEIDLGGLYDIIQVIYYNRSNCASCQLTANGMKLELFDENRQRTGNSVLTNALVQYINFTSDTAPTYCPKMYTGLRGNVIDPPAVIQQNIVSIAPTASNSLYNLFNYPPSDPSAYSSNVNSGAQWIWNNPYAAFSVISGDVTFYTTVNNNSYQPISYTMTYGVKRGIVKNITVNNVILTPTNGSVTFNILPGDNYIQATVQPVDKQENGFQAVLSNSKTRQYEKPTNSVNWNAITSPSNSFSGTPTTFALYNVGNSNIWNQPNAVINAGNQDMDFNLNLPVTGTSVLTYSIVYRMNTTTYKVTIIVNSLVIINNENSSSSWKEVTFQVVPGQNFIKVELTGGTGRAGFAAYIKDNNGTSIKPTDIAASGWYTTKTTAYDCKNTCAYISETDTNIPRACLSNIWNSNSCSGDLPSDDFNSYTMSGFSANVYVNYASPTATNANQLICSGAAVATYPLVTITPPTLASPNTWASGTSLNGASWSWNKTGSIPAGTTIKLYTSFSYTSGTCTLYYANVGTAAIYLNGKARTGLPTNSATAMNSITLLCRQGTNVLRVDITTGSTAGPAGFVAYIQIDAFNTNKTPNNWVTTTPSACGIYNSTDTNISQECLNNIWSAQCTGTFPTTNFSAFTMSGFSDEVRNNWASRTATDSTKQISCKGIAVCDTGYLYNGTSGKCEKTVYATGGPYWSPGCSYSRPTNCIGSLPGQGTLGCAAGSGIYLCSRAYTCSEGTLSDTNCLIQKNPNF